MPSDKQRAAARRNIKKAHNKVQSGQAKSRSEIEAQARKLDVWGQSTMGKEELRRAVARWR